MPHPSLIVRNQTQANQFITRENICVTNIMLASNRAFTKS